MQKNTRDMLYKRGRLVGTLSVLLLIALVLSGSTFLFIRYSGSFNWFNRSGTATTVAQVPNYGLVTFSSSDPAITGDSGESSQHLMDQVSATFKNLAPPPSGKAYFAWLLAAGCNAASNPLLIGAVTAANDGTWSMTPTSNSYNPYNVKRPNLLGNYSCFLLTEESSATPTAPTDTKAWMYFAQIPQTTSDTTSGLNYIKHLLVSDQLSSTKQLTGGLAVHFLAQIRNVYDDAADASTTTTYQTMHNDTVQILDWLDGQAGVIQDYNPNINGNGTDDVSPPFTFPDKPLLLDANAQVQGYLSDIGANLAGYHGAVNVNSNQRNLCVTITNELNAIKAALLQIEKDAKDLANLPADNYQYAAHAQEIDDLATQATLAYLGQLDQNNAVAVFQHIEQLAQFPLIKWG